MFDPTDKKTKNLIKKYRAFYEMAMKKHEETSLSFDEIKAVGKRVLNDILETAFKNQNVQNEDRAEFIKQFEELIRQECPDITFDTPLKFDEDGFSEKE